MSNLLVIPNISQTCLVGFICANETFIAIYGVIFTIVISLGVYIYGLQDKSEKITLTKNTNIKKVITQCLGFFALSFLAFPSPFYEFVNFILSASLLLSIFDAFKEVFKFNENELSGERAVKKFKEEVIKEKLKEFEDLKIKNDALQKLLEEKRDGKDVERFLLDENNDSYYFIRAQSSGYITNIDINVLFTEEIYLTKETSQKISKKYSYYIPYSISNGAPVDFDDVILGIKKEEGQKIDEEKLRSFVSISDEYENPSSYLEAEMRSYYSEMFSLIKMEDSKGLELKLKEFSSFVDHFTCKADSYVDIIQFINDDIIFPLQKYSFKQGDIDCIKKVVGFSLGYIYQSLDKKSVQTFNIFLRNFGHAFYESFDLSPDEQTKFHDAYFRWLNEVAKYSIKSKIKKDKNYIDYAINFLSSLNGQIKIAFDKKNLEAFSKALAFLDNSFSRESYEHDEFPQLDELILIKKAVIFGFTAWAYKHNSGGDFYKEAFSKLLSSLQKDPVYYYRNVEDNLNYYLSIYLKAIEISEKRGSFGWDSWGMPEGEVYTVTIHDDIKNLLVDRILKIIVDDPNLAINIKDGNYNDGLSHIKEGNQQFDPLLNKTQHSFVSITHITDEQFISVKIKFYNIFSQIAEKYETDVRKKIIEQSLDDTKFNEFVKENFDSYEKARVLYRVQKFTKDTEKKIDGFGYNILLHKEQFIAETNVHYTNGNQFGEDLARSEDNKVLESIYKKFGKIIPIKKEKIGQIVSAENNLSAIVLWINGYFNIQDTNPENFKPHWQETNSREDNGPYYQGSINGIPFYIVYKFQEHKSYPDTMFIFENDSFSINEFEIEEDKTLDKDNTKFAEKAEDCLMLSITNLSSLEQERIKIVEKWTENDPDSIKDKEAKVEELKTNVVFKFFKGLSADSLIIDNLKIKIFHIK
ncbi:MAG: hypothetical protein WCS86_02385 [Candidatus Paceibacterota bacterium]